MEIARAAPDGATHIHILLKQGMRCYGPEYFKVEKISVLRGWFFAVSYFSDGSWKPYGHFGEGVFPAYIVEMVNKRIINEDS